MKLLLDTHVWLWIHLEAWKLTSEIHQTLASTHNELWLSPVSIWELTILLEKKRISLSEEMDRWVEKSKKELSLREAPFTWEVAKELRYTLLAHRDPGDRFLVATARTYSLTLVTADEQLFRAPGLAILANR